MQETPSRAPAASPPARRGRPPRWWYLPAATVAIIAVSLLAIVRLYGPGLSLSTAPRPAPNFVLRDQQDRSHRLSDYLGRTVVLTAFGEDNSATRATLQALNASLSELEMHGVKVFGIAALDPLRARKLHATARLRFPLLADPHGEVRTALHSAEPRGLVSGVVSPTGALRATVTEPDAARHGAQLRALVECCTREFAPAPSRTLGHRLPNFFLPDAVDGRPTSLFGEGRPPATVLVFLSSECPCSRSYDRRLARLATELAPQGVRVVGINASANEPAEEIAAHARHQRFPFPVLLDRRQVVLRRLGARMTPEAYVADSTGTIRYHGRIDDSRNEEAVQSHDLREAALAVLRGRAPHAAETTPFGCAISPVEQESQDKSTSAQRRVLETASTATQGENP